MEKYVSFVVENEEFGIPILNVQEILRPTEVVRLPGMPPYLLGVMNIRGMVVPVVDLKSRIFGKPCDGGEERRFVVINIGRFTYGALVDRITGVVEVEEKDLERPSAEKADYLTGVIILGDGRILEVLDPTLLIPVSDRRILEEEVVEREVLDDGRVLVSKKIGSMGGGYVIKEVKERIMEEAERRGTDMEPLKEMMERIEAFLKALSEGDFSTMESIVQELSSASEKKLFHEVGRIARNIHNSLVEFKTLIDPRLKNLALEEMPEVADRLNWVISKTEEAASKTLNMMEKNLSLQSDMIKRLDLIDTKVKGKEAKEAVAFLRSKLEEMNGDFMEVIMAQEFQDLTGQIIKRVINLITEVEAQLVELVRVFGVKIEPQKKEKALSGPQIKKGEDVLSNQEEVDTLLKEFGF